MNTENTFQNDMFATLLTNPQAKFEDYVAHGFNVDNTGLLAPEEYKKLDKVQEIFTKNGQFDEESFNNAYLTAAYNYNELAEGDLFKKLEQYVEYSPYSMYAPLEGKTSDWTPSVEKIKNPYENTYGINSLYGVTETHKSNRELAQTNTHYFDWNKQEWVEQSPDDFGISSIWKEPMVYAQWTSDGYHKDLETGQTVQHKKGEWKTDQNGRFYMETLGDRESYGMEIASSWDTLTSEGSFMNSINVFESDDKEKSIAGTTVKLAATLIPYFIPGFNSIWGAIHMSYGLASVMPSFIKSLEGAIIGGENKSYDEQSAIWQFATKAENWFGKFKPSVSDEGKNSLLNYEQMGQIVGDVFAQIYEQRAAASFAGKFLKTKQKTEEAVKTLSQTHLGDALQAQMSGINVDDFFSVLAQKSPKLVELAERQSKLAQKLSIGYMALTQSAEVYREGIEAGFDKRAAGITSLLANGLQYSLMMNNRLGDWFLEKTTGYTKENVNREIRQALLKYLPEFEAAIKQVDDAIASSAKIEAKKGLVRTLTKAKNSVLNLISNGPNDYLGSAGIEAIEEVTEELAIDFAKSVTNTLSWLGVWRNNSQFFKEGFFTEKTFERYLTSAIGGAVGGALFRLNDNVIAPKINGIVSANQKRDLIELIADGHTNDILNEVAKLGSLSPVSTNPINIKGININLKTSSNGQSDLSKVSSVMSSYVKWMDGVLNQSGFAQDNKSVIKKALLDKQAVKLFKESKLDNFILEDFKTKVQTYVDQFAKLEAAEEGNVSPELKKSVEDSKQLVEDILTGKQNEHYMQLASLILNKNIRESFDGMDFVTFAESYYKKSYSNFSEDEKNKAKNEYKKYIESSNVLEYLNTRIEAFKNLQSKFSKSVKEYIESDYITLRKKVLEEFYDLPKTEKIASSLINFINFKDLNNLLSKVITPELLPIYKSELDQIQELWKNKDSNTIKELENFLYKLENSVDDEFKPEIKNEVNKLNNNKQIVYNLLDQLHELEQKSKSGIFFNTYFKTDLYKQFNKIVTMPFDKIFKQRAKEIGIDLSEDEELELKNKFIQDLDNQLLLAPMYVIQSTTAGSLIKDLILKYTKEIQNIDQEHIKLAQLKDKNEISEAEFLNQQRELYKNEILFGIFGGKLTEDQFNLLKETYIEYWEQYIKDNNISEYDDVPYDESHFPAIKHKFYNKLSDVQITSYFDNLVNQVLNELLNNQVGPENHSWGDYEYSDYDKSNWERTFNLYEQSFEDYFENLEYLDEEELSIYLDLKLNNAVKSLTKFKKYLDLEALPKKLKEAYYSGQDVYEVISKILDEIKNNNPEIKDEQIDPIKFKLLTKGVNPEEKRNKIKVNTIYKILKDLDLYIGNEKTTLFSLIEQLKLDLSNVKFSDFVAKEAQINAIKQALKTTKMLYAIIDGMIEQDVDLDEPFGFNTAVVKYLNKYENGVGVEKYNLITSDQAKIIKRDIKKLLDQLESALNLSELNSASQLQRNKKMQENFQKVVLERFKNLGSCTIDGSDISKLIKNILSSDKQDDEKLLEIENLLYDSINSKKSNLKKLLSVLKLNSEDIAKKVSFGLSATTIQISDYDFSNWLGAILTVRSSNFRQLYIDHFKRPGEESIAPLFGQKLAIQLGYSFIKSNSENDIYQHILDVVFDKGHEFTSNLFYISAIGGAGKSSVIAKTLFELVKDEFDNIGILAPNITAAKRLRDSILKNNPEHVHNEIQIKELLKVALKKSKNAGLTDDELNKLFAQSTKMKRDSDNGIVQNDKNFKLKKDHGLIVRDPKDWKSKAAPIIFIDEVTNFSTPVLQALNLISKKAGIKVITLGDDAQLGLNETIDDLLTRGSIKLSFSMRYNNKLKGDNDGQLSTFLQQTINSKELPGDSEYIESIKKSNFVLSYHQNESELIGDKIVKSLGDELKVFKNILELKPKQKILIVTENGKLSDVLKNKLNDVGITKDNYRITSIDPNSDISVQGDEAEYIIVDSLNFTDSEAYYQFKKLYTSVSRSLIGSLFYDPASNIYNTFGIISSEKPFEPFKVFTPESIKKLTEDTIFREEELLKKYPVKFSEDSKKKFKAVKKDEENEDEESEENKEGEEYKENGEEDKDENDEDEEDNESRIKFTPGEDLNNPKNVKEQQEEFKKATEDLKEIFKETENEIETRDSSEFEEDDNVSGNEPTETIPTEPNDLGIETTEGNLQEVKKEEELKEDLSTLQIHPFYNRIGCILDSDNQAIANTESNEDLNIFKPDENSKYSEDQINCFLFFKNMLSLYSDSDIKNSFIKNDTSEISNKILRNLGITVRNLDNITFGNIFLQAKYYNSKIDDPIGVFEYSNSEKLTDLDEKGKPNIFITLAREVIIKGKSYFVTIGAFPQFTTLDKAFAAKIINQTTIKSYKNFESELRSKLEKDNTGFIQEFGTFENFQKLIQDTTGVRVDKLENGFIDFQNLSKYKGLYYNRLNISSLCDEVKNNTEKILAVSSEEYITNIAESIISKTVVNRDKLLEEKKKELKSKLFDENGFKLRGFPVLKMYVTPNDFRYIPLYPKSRSYNDALNELNQFKNKPTAFMDSTSTFNLIWAITQYKDLFLEQLESYEKEISDSNKGLKNTLENLISFLKDVDYRPYSEFKDKYYSDYMSKRIYKGAGYYISQQIKNLEAHEWFIDVTDDGLAKSTTSILSDIKKSIGSKIDDNIVVNDQVFYSKNSLKDDDGKYKIDPDSLYKYYKISKSVQMPTLYLNMGSIFKLSQIESSKKLIRLSTDESSGNQDLELESPKKDLFNSNDFSDNQKAYLSSISEILKNLSVEEVKNLYESFNNNYEKFGLEYIESYDDLNEFIDDYSGEKSEIENYIETFYKLKISESDVFDILNTFKNIKDNCN